MSDLKSLLQRHLCDPQSGWSMGSFGAIAEFHQDAGEAWVIDRPGDLERASGRGGIRLDPGALDSVRPVAYETLSPRRHRWSQALSLCLPASLAARARRDRLTELGPDQDALRDSDREAILFDMGLALPQCDFCVRSADPELVALLRDNLGRSLLEPGNPAMGAILAAHPHRVALTAVGRVEVYQKIGGPDTGGVSPQGPHTHVLPKLLRSGRTHSANAPIPDAWSPVATLHPASPVMGALGEDIAFDADRFTAFQALLGVYGRSELVAVKQGVRRAVIAGDAPQSLMMPGERFARAAFRLSLRQLHREAQMRADAVLLRNVEAWMAEHDRTAELEDDDRPGH